MGYTVPAGSETGIYYLIIGGVEFKATWKDFKDYARSHQLDVDYVEIYGDKHGGWLRLLGHDNFLKAFEIFNGAQIRGFSIQAHAQNETNCAVLRYPPPSLQQPLRQQPATTQPPVQSHPRLPTPPGHFSYSTSPPYTPSSPTNDGYYTHNPYPQSNIFPQPVNPGSQVAFQAQLPLATTIQYSYASADAMPYSTPSLEQATVRTEFRKVVIKNLPDYMTTDCVQSLMEWALKDLPGYDPSWLEEIDLPKPKPGKTRRHACVLLQSFPLAERIKSCLHGYCYEGKNLSVEYAKEGATPFMSKEAAKLLGESSLDKQHRPRTPVVVDGSGSRSGRRGTHRH